MDRNLLMDKNAVNCQSTASGISTKTVRRFLVFLFQSKERGAPVSGCRRECRVFVSVSR